MSDITDLFSRVAPSGDADPSAETIEADLARGRLALARDHRRRTIRRSMLATTSLAAGVAVIIVATQLGGSSPAPQHTTGAHHPTTQHNGPVVKSAQPHKKASSIKLVAYTGKQVNGFTVDKVPAGWFLGGSSQYALTINSAGDKDLSPDDFEGKLTVLLASKDETSFPKQGDHVTVSGQPGIIWNGGEMMLGYTDAAGHRLVIQVPDKLGWSDDQIVAFAQGVHVTANALAGVG